LTLKIPIAIKKLEYFKINKNIAPKTVYSNKKNSFIYWLKLFREKLKIVKSKAPHVRLEQGWPDFLDRGPNLKTVFHCGPNYSK